MQAEEENEEIEKDDVVKVTDDVDFKPIKLLSQLSKAMEKKSSETLEYKRSFFVRMVSDPKLYNPKIVKMDRRQKLHNMGITSDCSDISPM